MPNYYEAECLRKDGTKFPILMYLTSIRFSTEHATLGFILDITERTQVEEALRASENHFHTLFDNMLEGYAYCKMIYENEQPSDFIYLEVNDAFEKLTGLKEVVGKKVSEVIPGIQEFKP